MYKRQAKGGAVQGAVALNPQVTSPGGAGPIAGSKEGAALKGNYQLAGLGSPQEAEEVEKGALWQETTWDGFVPAYDLETTWMFMDASKKPRDLPFPLLRNLAEMCIRDSIWTD